MAMEQFSDQLSQVHLGRVVKEEPPDEGSDFSSFCYETVTKEEVILEDLEIHADGQPESVSGPPTGISLKCSECNRMFDKIKNRLRCEAKHKAIKLGTYACKFCGKCFGTKYNQVQHEETHKRDPPQKADDEGGSWTRSSIDVTKDENGLFKCPDCGRAFQRRSLAVKCAKRHLAKRLGLYQCKICQLCAGTRSDLRIHELIHNRHETEKPFKCSECNRTFDNVAYLNRCVRRHNAFKAGLFKCTYCGMYWATNYELVRHVRIKHKQEATPESGTQTSNDTSRQPQQHATSSSISNQMVKKENQLIEDEALENGRTEEDSLESLAEQCSIKASLDIPKQRTRERSINRDKDGFLNCPECDLRFTKRKNFTAHRQRHKAIRLKLFECQFCKKCFAKRSVLETHLQSHTGSDLIKMKCEACSKVFTRKYYFEKHKQMHEKELLGQAHVCQICHEKFENRHIFYRHKKTHAKDVKKPQN